MNQACLRWGVLAAVVLGSACGPAEESPRGEGVTIVVDSSGLFPVVHNSGSAPTWTMDTIGTVGSQASLGAPAPDEFGRISSLASGPDDAVWVADQMNDRIKVFRPDGSLERELGREGQGPGEYSSIYSIAWVGDRLLALDLGNGRIAELSPSGDWLGTRPAPGRVSGSPALLRFYPVSDSSVVQWSLETVDGEARRVWVEHGPGGVVQTWPQLAVDPPEPTTLVCPRPDGATSFFSIPFSGQVLQHPAVDGRSYRAWSGAYRLALVGPTGDTLRVVEREWPEVSVTDEEWERATAEFSEFRDTWPGVDCTPRSMRRPATKAALRNLLIDTAGRIWAEAVSAAGPVWEIFDAEGRLLGAMPGFAYDERVAPAVTGNGIAWASTDSLGVQRVHWARVTPPSSF